MGETGRSDSIQPAAPATDGGQFMAQVGVLFAAALVFVKQFCRGTSRPNRLDDKYFGILFREADGAPIGNDGYMVFRAKDNAVPDMLTYYRARCEQMDCEQSHLDAVDRLIGRTLAWRVANPDLCKKPDTPAPAAAQCSG